MELGSRCTSLHQHLLLTMEEYSRQLRVTGEIYSNESRKDRVEITLSIPTKYSTMTVLFIAQHNQTGKKYLGKTSRPEKLGTKYFGSGLHWKAHLNQHGRDVRIISRSEVFTDEAELEEFALLLSEELNIVQSDEYLNLVEENGLDGGDTGLREDSRTRWQTKSHHCVHCDDYFFPQVYGNFHGKYCEKNPKREVKSKIKCENCGEEKLPHIYHRDHGPKCGKKKRLAEGSRPKISCLDCKQVLGGLSNLNQHIGSKPCAKNQKKMSLHS